MGNWYRGRYRPRKGRRSSAGAIVLADILAALTMALFFGRRKK